ncbi:MAG: TonB-dependent receptor domain-containing protein [Bryobacteraceae bacterium]
MPLNPVLKPILVCALAVLCGSGAFGQGVTGAITGVITDPQEAVIAGAIVTARNVATGLTTQSTSNSSGVYNLPSLPIGTYELKVEAPGFKTYTAQKVEIDVANTVRVDPKLEVGSVGESVTVDAQAPMLQTESSTVGTEVTRKMLNDLPFQLTGASRDPTAFIRLTPGASGGAFGANIAGGRQFASEVLVDGVPVAYNAATNTPDQDHPTYDSVAEFKVQAVIPPAEYGRTSSGVVSMVTRSGTNELHGDVLLLLRNNVLDSRRYNARIADITRQAEFTGSVGGPVVLPKIFNGRNRTFFFGTYTGFRRANVPQGVTGTVGTDRERNGDFSDISQPIYDPLTADVNGNRQQFPGNIIPPSRIGNFAKAVNAVIPGPNAPGLSNNYLGGTPATQNEDHFLIKIDHQISDKNKFSGNVRYENNRRTFSRGPLPQVSDGFQDAPNSRNVVLSDDYIIRPNLVNRAQAGFTRFMNPTASSQNIGLKVPGAFSAGFPSVTFSSGGYTTIANTDFRFEADNNYDVQDAISWTKGSHNFKFGARADEFQFNFIPRGNEAGTYGFSPFATSQPGVNGTGNAYASFILGAVNNASLSKGTPYALRSQYFGLYAQDDWKATRKLTVNYGLRWEIQVPWYEAAGRLSQFDPTVPNPGAGGLPGAIVFAGSGPGRIGGRGFQKTYLGGVGPRVGLAYQVGANTVVRAGYAVMYAPIIGNNINQQGINASINVTSQNGGITPVFYIDRGFPPGLVQPPPLITPTIANNQSTATSEDRRGGSGRLAQTQQWQLNVEHTFKSILFEGSYAGTVAHHIGNNALVQINQLNPKYLALGSLLTKSIADPSVQAAGYGLPYPGFTGTLAQSLRPYPQYQGITDQDSPTGNSSYHAFLFKSEKRFAFGLQFLVAYTYSKALTDIAFDVNNAALSAPQDQYNRRVQKGFATTDVPQRLILSYSYELPWGKGKPFLNSGWTSRILGGFLVSGIHTYQSGSVIRITTPNGLPLFNGQLEPNRVLGVPIRIGPDRGGFQPFNSLSGQKGDLYLNANAFQVPPPYTLGTLSYFLPDVRNFPVENEDLSIVKKQYFRETKSFELRVDFFNAFNRRILSGLVTDLSNPNFGRYTGQNNPRQVQLGFRVDF